ncbi:helix-turn-helix domain-containing protein [Candidatus Pacearchaeota archaeon]|nr:helix-turn-helix domain-containing protein [Candidatus Pacearchaeota archaeon]
MFEELKELGLTDNQIKIYEILLKEGMLKPAEIAKKIEHSRPYVYESLERLEEKQMVSSLINDNKKVYQATDPKRVIEIMKAKLTRVESILPKLLTLSETSHGDIKAELYKGKNVMSQNLLKDIIARLKKGDEVLVFGIDDKKLIKEDKYYQVNLLIYLEKIKRLGIKERIIVKKGTELEHVEKTTKYKHLPDRYFGNVTFQVYGNKTAILLWGNLHHLILIENKEVADAYRKQFELLWKIAK